MDENGNANVFPGSDRFWTIFGALFTPVSMVADSLFLKSGFTKYCFQSIPSTGVTCCLVTALLFLPFIAQAQRKYKHMQTQLSKSEERAKRAKQEDGQHKNFMKVTSKIITEIDYLLSFNGSRKHPFFTKHSKIVINKIFAGATNLVLRDESDIMKAMILEPNKNGKRLKLKAILAESDREKRNINLDIDKSFAGDCMRTKKPLICNSTKDNTIDLHDLKNHKRIKSIACFPIMFMEDVLGVFCVTSELENSFEGSRFVGYLEFFAEILALVMRIQGMGDVVCERLVMRSIIVKGGSDNGTCRFEKTTKQSVGTG